MKTCFIYSVGIGANGTVKPTDKEYSQYFLFDVLRTRIKDENVVNVSSIFAFNRARFRKGSNFYCILQDGADSSSAAPCASVVTSPPAECMQGTFGVYVIRIFIFFHA